MVLTLAGNKIDTSECGNPKWKSQIYGCLRRSNRFITVGRIGHDFLRKVNPKRLKQTRDKLHKIKEEPKQIDEMLTSDVNSIVE